VPWHAFYLIAVLYTAAVVAHEEIIPLDLPDAAPTA
jgi:hypothetical protein